MLLRLVFACLLAAPAGAAVPFETSILPFLKQSCLACHNQTKAKAGLNLESPAAMLAGGDSGPAIVPGKPEESLLLKVAGHQQEPFMPPPDNQVKAQRLSDGQLALLRQWIQEGAAGGVQGGPSIPWRPLPSRVRPILALALTSDGQFAACGRGNELAVYHIPSRRMTGSLLDPDLRLSSAAPTGAAHLDLVQAVDFSPDGDLLASGSYREVKLWRRQAPARTSRPAAQTLESAGAVLADLSPDGAFLAAVTRDLDLRVWDTTTQAPVRTRRLELMPEALAWVEGAARLATAAGTNIQIWSRDLRPALALVNPRAVAALAAQAGQLISGDDSGMIRWWNVDSGETVQTLTNESPVSALAVSPDGKKLAVAGTDKVVRLINLDTKKISAGLKGDYQSARRLARLERSAARASLHAAWRKTALEQTEKERQAQVARVRKAGESAGAAEKALVTLQSQLADAQAEEAAAQKELAGLPEQGKLKEAMAAADQALADLAKSKTAVKEAAPDAIGGKLDELVARASSAALATNLLAALKTEIEKSENAAREKIKAAQKKVSGADAVLQRGRLTNAASANELQFAIASAQKAFDALAAAQEHLQIAGAAQKQHELQLEAARQALAGSMRVARALAFSPDGAWLAAGGEHSVTLWNPESQAPLEDLGGAASSLAFLENALLTLEAGRAAAWELFPAWRLERVITSAHGQPAFADRVAAVAFSPDGQFLATGGGEPSRSGEIKIWRVQDGRLLHEFNQLHSDAILALAYSPDSRYLASGGADRFAKVIEAASGTLVRALEGHTGHILALAWKADGHTLITAGADRQLKTWEAFTGEKMKGPAPFDKEVTAAAFLAETDQLLAASADGVLHLIKDNGEKIRVFEGTSGYLQAAVASPDGALVLAGGQDGRLRLWQAETGKLLAEF